MEDCTTFEIEDYQSRRIACFAVPGDVLVKDLELDKTLSRLSIVDVIDDDNILGCKKKIRLKRTDTYYSSP